MAFVIKLEDKSKTQEVRTRLDEWLARSRFTAGVTYDEYEGIVTVGGKHAKGVRLRQKKDYCGNHAGPCRLGDNNKHSERTYLEGSDWLSWNQSLNNILDELGVSAKVGSSTVIIRKGRMRRFRYSSEGHGDWKKDEPNAYADCIGKSPPTLEYTPGTPGILDVF